jgi:hypothetical protein
MSKNISISFGQWPLIITMLLCLCKVTGVLSISWWWCFCAIWLPFAIVFGIIGLFVAIAVPFLIIALIIEILNNR